MSNIVALVRGITKCGHWPSPQNWDTPGKGGLGGGAPLARLFCISNNFNNHEHKREEDTLK